MNTRIIIPTYNERENIVRLIEELMTVTPTETRILVVDDNSPDGTGNLVREIAEKNSRVTLMARSQKLGLGSAYRAAFRKALDEGGDDVFVTMDADFSHDPRYVPELIAKTLNFDLVVGSRYITGGKTENWELWRRALSWGGNRYVRLITGLPISDCTAGFSAMRTDFLKKIPFERIETSGYAWWFTLRMMLWRNEARITEVPITFTDRRLGSSKISANIIYEGLIEPWRIRFTKS